MKKFLSILLVFCALLGVFVSCDSGSGAGEGTTAADPEATTTAATTTAPPPADQPSGDKLYVGFAREVITPVDENGDVMAVQLAGYPGTRLPKTVINDIYATCIAFKDEEGNTALLFNIDLINIPTDLVDRFTKAVYKETQVPTKNIILNCSHSHTAPMLIPSKEENNKYINSIFEPGLIKAAETAIEDLTLCKDLYIGTFDAKGLNFIRRYITDEQGKMKHEYESDSRMPVARFVRDGKKDVILANWSAHSDTVTTYNKYSISSDYYFFFRNKVEETLGAHMSISNGASGDVNPYSKIDGETVYKSTRAYGEALANIVISNISTLEKVEIKGQVKSYMKSVYAEINHTTDSLRYKAQEISDLYNKGETAKYNAKCKEYGISDVIEAGKIITRAQAGKYQGVTVGALSIGNIVFGVGSYEMASHSGKTIKEGSKFDLTFVCGYSNGSNGYIPAEFSFANGGYEVSSCLFIKGTAEKLQGEISAAIDKLYTDIYGE